MRDEGSIKEYEIAYLTKSEGDARDLLDAVKAQGGEVFLEGPLNKISLAYKIDNETSAYFGYAHFKADPASIKPLQDGLKLKAGVLRSMVISPPFVKGVKTMPPYKTRSQKPAPEAKDQPPEPLSNEALEKKIEEILNK